MEHHAVLRRRMIRARCREPHHTARRCGSGQR